MKLCVHYPDIPDTETSVKRRQKTFKWEEGIELLTSKSLYSQSPHLLHWSHLIIISWKIKLMQIHINNYYYQFSPHLWVLFLLQILLQNIAQCWEFFSYNFSLFPSPWEPCFPLSSAACGKLPTPSTPQFPPPKLITHRNWAWFELNTFLSPSKEGEMLPFSPSPSILPFSHISLQILQSLDCQSRMYFSMHLPSQKFSPC